MIAGGGGSIIFIASQLGRVGSAGRAAYCATKGRADPARQGHGDRPRGAEHPGQHAVARRRSRRSGRCNRYGRFAAARREHRAEAPAGPPRPAATRSPPPRCFSPATRRASSPAAICWSTAATRRFDPPRQPGPRHARRDAALYGRCSGRQQLLDPLRRGGSRRCARPPRTRARTGRAPPDRSAARCRIARAGRRCGTGRAPPRRSKPGSPEAIFAWYSCARRLHIVRLARERPRNLASAASISFWLDSRRSPDTLAFPSGTRSVIRSLSKVHDKDAEHMAGDLLRLDGGDLADPMGRIDHQIAGGEWQHFRQSYSSLVQPDPTGRCHDASAVAKRVGDRPSATRAERGTKGKTPIAPADVYTTNRPRRASRSAMSATANPVGSGPATPPLICAAASASARVGAEELVVFPSTSFHSSASSGRASCG